MNSYCHFKLITFGWLAFFVSFNWCSSDIVTIEQGRYSGSVEIFENVRVERFLGIAYAQPPIGDLRFKRTKSIRIKSELLQSATEWPSSCLQDSTLVKDLDYQSKDKYSEDCLYLNIWTPQRDEGQLKPVLFYIHGGAYVMGSASQAIYNALPLSAIGNVVVVTFNYRLGAFGFVYGGDSSFPGNLAIYDQIEALKWVKDNIEPFGGDPDRITVFGESAGSISTGIFLLSPLTKNLFRNAILMSGSPLNPLMIQTSRWSLKTTVALAKRVGCIKQSCVDSKFIKQVMQEIITCLQTVNSSNLIKEQDAIATSTMPFAPFHGDDILPHSPADLVRQQAFKSNSSIMVGVVTYEGSVVEDGLSRYPELRPILNTGTQEQWYNQLRSKIDNLPRKPGSAANVADLYFRSAKDDPITSRKIYSEALGDYYLGCPTLILGEKLATKNNVFAYHFSYKSVSRGAKSGYNLNCDENYGVCHATELQFLFGTPLIGPNSYNEEDRLISREMISIWSSLANGDRVSWHPYYAASNLTIPVNYELNPSSSNNKLTNDYKYLTCKAWEPFVV